MRPNIYICKRKTFEIHSYFFVIIFISAGPLFLNVRSNPNPKHHQAIWVIFKGFSLIWNYLLYILIYYYFTSWRQHPTKHQLYGHLPPITKSIQVRRSRHAGQCWRSRDDLISDVLLWTPTYGRAKAGRPARTYIQQLCEDTGCSPENLPEAMNDREKWRERARDIHASDTTLLLLLLLLLLFYIELSVEFWITWILKNENPKIESFPPSADLALEYIYIGNMNMFE